MKATRKTDMEDKQFILELMNYPTLEQVTLPERRYYLDSDKNEYESATTWLSRHSDKSPIDAWIKRVGQAEADRITNAAVLRGTVCHELIEDYLLGNKSRHKGGTGKILFKQMRKLLNKINRVKGIECQLYSRKMGIAGTSDCIGFYKDTLSIIDFKTSLRDKKREWIENYFIQGTLYAIMYWELFGVWIDQIVILIGVENSTEPQEFIVKTNDQLAKIKEYLEKDKC